MIHINFRVTKCGTIINKEYPFIHATPDFLCSCDCCGSGCGEVKCPYFIEGLDFDTYVLGKTSCLEKKDSTFLLKRDHDYYFQVQQQLHTTKYTYCDFVVCAFDMKDSKLVQERILSDNAHWEIQIQKLSIFWRICILPEILGRWYTRKLHLKEDKNPVNYDGDCYCQMKTNEKTVMCSNILARYPSSIHHVFQLTKSLRLGIALTAVSSLNFSQESQRRCKLMI